MSATKSRSSHFRVPNHKAFDLFLGLFYKSEVDVHTCEDNLTHLCGISLKGSSRIVHNFRSEVKNKEKEKSVRRKVLFDKIDKIYD